MDCIPPCKHCTGLCRVSVPRRDTVRYPPAPVRKPPYATGAGYILLTCEHWTTPEEQTALRSIYGIKRGKRYWCPNCDDWKGKKRDA